MTISKTLEVESATIKTLNAGNNAPLYEGIRVRYISEAHFRHFLPYSSSFGAHVFAFTVNSGSFIFFHDLRKCLILMLNRLTYAHERVHVLWGLKRIRLKELTKISFFPVSISLFALLAFDLAKHFTLFTPASVSGTGKYIFLSNRCNRHVSVVKRRINFSRFTCKNISHSHLPKGANIIFVINVIYTQNLFGP